MKTISMYLDPGGKRVNLQSSPITENWIAYLLECGYAKHQSAVVRQAVREAVERQKAIRENVFDPGQLIRDMEAWRKRRQADIAGEREAGITE